MTTNVYEISVHFISLVPIVVSPPSPGAAERLSAGAVLRETTASTGHGEHPHQVSQIRDTCQAIQRTKRSPLREGEHYLE